MRASIVVLVFVAVTIAGCQSVTEMEQPASVWVSEGEDATELLNLSSLEWEHTDSICAANWEAVRGQSADHNLILALRTPRDTLVTLVCEQWHHSATSITAIKRGTLLRSVKFLRLSRDRPSTEIIHGGSLYAVNDTVVFVQHLKTFGDRLYKYRIREDSLHLLHAYQVRGDSSIEITSQLTAF